MISTWHITTLSNHRQKTFKLCINGFFAFCNLQLVKTTYELKCRKLFTYSISKALIEDWVVCLFIFWVSIVLDLFYMSLGGCWVSGASQRPHGGVPINSGPVWFYKALEMLLSRLSEFICGRSGPHVLPFVLVFQNNFSLLT